MIGLLIVAMKGLVLVPQATYMQAILAFGFCPETLLQGKVVAKPAAHSDPFSIVNALYEILRNLAQCSLLGQRRPSGQGSVFPLWESKCRHLGSRQGSETSIDILTQSSAAQKCKYE